MQLEKGTFGIFPAALCRGLDAESQILLTWIWFHKNQEGVAWPSLRLLAEESGLGVTTVKGRLDKLVGLGLLDREGIMRPHGGYSSNHYTVRLTPSILVAGRPPSSDGGQGMTLVAERGGIPRPTGGDSPSGDQPKKNQIQGTKTSEPNSKPESLTPNDDSNEEKVASPPSLEANPTVASRDVVAIFDAFLPVSPRPAYGNHTQRSAAEWLVNRMGVEEAVTLIGFAVGLQGVQYAPVITTPDQLVNKMGQLAAYKKRAEVSHVTFIS